VDLGLVSLGRPRLVVLSFRNGTNPSRNTIFKTVYQAAEPTMMISLNENSEVRSVSKKEAANLGKDHVFSIRGADGDVGLFMAATPDDKQQWMKELELCLANIIAPILRQKGTLSLLFSSASEESHL